MRRFEGKTAVVTGGNKGIGYAIAARFAQEGANIVLASIEEQVGDAAKQLESKTKSKIVPIVCDVSSASDVKNLYDNVLQQFGAVDISVQNAGIITIAKVEDLTEKEWDDTMDINTKGVFLCCQEAIRRMRQTGTGGTGKRSCIGSHYG